MDSSWTNWTLVLTVPLTSSLGLSFLIYTMGTNNSKSSCLAASLGIIGIIDVKALVSPKLLGSRVVFAGSIDVLC